ncbi:MAG: acyl-CoA dehydrogenase [Alphaproteobacteria bacterium]|nr:acyl-CoA dehydrogenase [Alphaproteobacteria bacterium]
MKPDLERLAEWVGRAETTQDVVTARKVAAMAATLDRDDPPPQDGDPLPPLWHWMFHAPIVRVSEVGPDGHPALGGFMPPVPLPQRMFAGGRLWFRRPVRVGEAIERRAEIAAVTPKTGSSGELVFVTVRHLISTAAGVAIEEEQDIVYREAVALRPGERAPAEVSGLPWRRRITPGPVMLFRYSALTFNGHRIHYDWPYATREEGYPGLVVHGPLIATYLAELCRDSNDGRALESFAFRARAPLFDTAPFEVAGGPAAAGDACTLIATGPGGETAMTATATLARAPG